MEHAPSRASDLRFESVEDYRQHQHTYYAFMRAIFMVAAAILLVLVILALVFV